MDKYLTDLQREAVNAVIKHGGVSQAAESLGWAEGRLYSHLNLVKRKWKLEPGSPLHVVIECIRRGEVTVDG